jgi:glycosyltransferase involved in cell wall biosynthesis
VERLLIVTPVRDEASNLRDVAEAMAAQSRPPDEWIVVDDRSTDGTRALATQLALEIPFMRVVVVTAVEAERPPDRLVSGAPARAFNLGLTAAAPTWDFAGKIDGDIVLPREYFERLLDEFHRNPELGIAGGQVAERFGDGPWRRVPVPSHHVNGPVKLYRRACFEGIGGVREQLGWDTIDEM